MAEIFHFERIDQRGAVHPAKGLTQRTTRLRRHGGKYAAGSPYNLIPVEKGKVLPAIRGNTCTHRPLKRSKIGFAPDDRPHPRLLSTFISRVRRAGNE